MKKIVEWIKFVAAVHLYYSRSAKLARTHLGPLAKNPSAIPQKKKKDKGGTASCPTCRTMSDASAL